MIVRAVITGSGAAWRSLCGKLTAGAAAAVFAASLGGCGSYVPVTATTSVAPPTSQASAQAAVWAANALGTQLLSRLDPGANAVLSPFSVETALAMLMQGAGGQTLTQMESVLNGNAPLALAASNHALAAQVALASTSFPQNGHPTLDSAASIWLQRGLSLSDPFQNTVTQDFGAVPNQIDFTTPSEAIAQINAWSSAHTDGLIPKLVDGATVDAQTKLLLATAIYLTARWKYPFSSSLTRPRPFHLANGSTTSVPMKQSGEAVKLPYAATSTYKAIELPYRSSNLAMLAVLPTPGHFESLLANLNATSFQSLETALSPEPENVAMPTVSLTLTSNLEAPLTQLGMASAFMPGADFSGITRAAKLHVQSVDHAALMRVYESGTTAAAATGISAAPTIAESGPKPTIEFDRPYYLFLIDRSTGVTLFAARVADPA